MNAKYWMVVAAAVVPLLACSSDDDGSGGSGGSAGSVVGVGGSGGSATGGTGGSATGGTGGSATGGTGGSATGGTGGTGGSMSCPDGMVEINNGGQCMCGLPCTAGDDSPCEQAMAGSHCCDFSSAGVGFLCGADQDSTCDSLIGSSCGSGGGSGTGLSCDALTQGQYPECDSCATACTTECNACNGSTDCLALMSCLYTCSDQSCIDGCASQYPNGVNDYSGFMTCLQEQNCTACFGS